MTMHSVRLSPPPRKLPLSLAIANVIGPWAQMGWLFFGFGMLFFWGFAMHADYSFFTDFGKRAQTKGIVQSVEETGASVDNRRVMAHHYQFSVAGRVMHGTSYSSDRHVARGETVTVDYLEKNPARSRIDGMRAEIFGPAVALVTILPLVGLIIVAVATRFGVVQNALLRNGMIVSDASRQANPAGARLTRIAGLLNVPAAQMKDIQTRMSRARSEPENGTLTLYDPQRPGQTGTVSPALIDENGELRGNVLAAIRVLLVPALMVGLNLLPILTRLGVDWVGALRDLLLPLFEKRS